jgi:hypothetical protein
MLKATKAFEKFLTDFSANKKRLEKIDAAAAELEIIFPDRKKEVNKLVKFSGFSYWPFAGCCEAAGDA